LRAKQEYRAVVQPFKKENKGERWQIRSFLHLTPRMRGFKAAKKKLYFDGGQVEHWKSQNRQ
jgi:hypothetical protein